MQGLHIAYDSLSRPSESIKISLQIINEPGSNISIAFRMLEMSSSKEFSA